MVDSSLVPTSLAACLAMTPADMAAVSPVVQDNWRYLLTMAGKIQDDGLREKITALLDNPAPSFLTLYGPAERKEMKRLFLKRGYISEKTTNETLFPPGSPARAPQPFWTAPGSNYYRHHPYPGGLAVHTAINLRTAWKLAHSYAETYSCEIDYDTVIAAQILHDAMKPWVLQWKPDGSVLSQIKIGRTGGHHVLGLSEALYRGIPFEVVVAQACTHSYPTGARQREEVESWLTAACLLAGKDPAREGWTQKRRIWLPADNRLEWYISHMGDYGWLVSIPTARLLIDKLERLAVECYGMKEADLATGLFYSFRNYVLSQATEVGLYQAYLRQGDAGFKQMVTGIVIPE